MKYPQITWKKLQWDGADPMESLLYSCFDSMTVLGKEGPWGIWTLLLPCTVSSGTVDDFVCLYVYAFMCACGSGVKVLGLD